MMRSSFSFFASAVLSLVLTSVALAQIPNIRIHPNASMQQIETPIAINPSNPNAVLVAPITASSVASIVSTGWHYTTDGGVTWIGRDTLPTHTDYSHHMVDPAAGIDADGNLYVAGIYGILGGAFDVYVARSTDQGANWTQTLVTSPSNAEQTDLTIDVNPGSPFKNYLYVAYKENGLIHKPTRFLRSTNGGQSFSAPVTISGDIGSVEAHGPRLAVSPDSVLYATWSGFDGPWPGPIRLGFNKSTDGGLSWATAGSIRSLSGIGTYLNKGGNSILVTTNPSIAVDRSSGPRRGWIYIVYSDKNPSTPDILLIRSTDGGDTWSNPIKVNQDNSGNDQWHPLISVDPSTGNMFVVYYDSRNFPANDSAQVYVSASTDGGETFRDLLVSDVPFLPAWASAAIVKPPSGYMGGYIGITALQGVVWPCWNDSRTGTHQAYTSRIVTDSVHIPATISVRPMALDFGDHLIGDQPETLSVTLGDRGFPDSLLVSDIHSDNSAFVPMTTSLGLSAGEAQGVDIVFIPSSEGIINAMLTISSSDTAHPTISIRMSATVLVTRAFSLNDGWNMVSVPMLVSDYRKTTIYPTATSPAFGYFYGYSTADTLHGGSGYWLKFSGAQSAQVTGNLILEDSLAVQAGWNMTGSISSPVDVSTITSNPPNLVTSQFFGYSSSGYDITDTIQPGGGYWVRVKQAGALFLSSNPPAAMSATNRIRIVPTSEMPPAPPAAVALANDVPKQYALEQAYPNPFNPTTVIRYSLPVNGYVVLKVYDMLGEGVGTLVNETKVPGSYEVTFHGSGLASGIYFYRLEATSTADPTRTFIQVRKMVVIK